MPLFPFFLSQRLGRRILCDRFFFFSFIAWILFFGEQPFRFFKLETWQPWWEGKIGGGIEEENDTRPYFERRPEYRWRGKEDFESAFFFNSLSLLVLLLLPVERERER